MDFCAEYGSIDCASRSMDIADPQIAPNIDATTTVLVVVSCTLQEEHLQTEYIQPKSGAWLKCAVQCQSLSAVVMSDSVNQFEGRLSGNVHLSSKYKQSQITLYKIKVYMIRNNFISENRKTPKKVNSHKNIKRDVRLRVPTKTRCDRYRWIHPLQC